MLDKELNIDKQIIYYAISFLLGLTIGLTISYLIFSKSKCEEVEDSIVEPSIEVEGGQNIPTEQDIESFDTIVSLPKSKCNTIVDISGAVTKPGVYCFEPNSTIMDAVERAKGFTQGGAHKYISMRMNLSLYLENNQKIYIPFESDVYCELRTIQIVDNKGNVEKEPTTTIQNDTPDNTGSTTTPSCININTASIQELTQLNGVGEATATKIIEGRPYSETKDIMNVSGIGEATYEKFKDDICV
jgi:competence protein ComEA